MKFVNNSIIKALDIYLQLLNDDVFRTRRSSTGDVLGEPLSPVPEFAPSLSYDGSEEVPRSPVLRHSSMKQSGDYSEMRRVKRLSMINGHIYRTEVRKSDGAIS